MYLQNEYLLPLALMILHKLLSNYLFIKKLNGELNLNSLKVEIVLHFLSDLIFTLLNIN